MDHRAQLKLGTNASPPSLLVVVPGRPALAPHVQLLGQMKETGFERQPWLVKCGDRYLQLTELLYRVAEQLDGQRTASDIAVAVSDRTGRGVSADNVQLLIAARLMPLGLIRDDGATGSSAAKGSGPMRSLLAVNVRIGAIGPRVLEPITRVLQYLFAPPILIAMLVLIGLCHWRVYGVMGISRVVHEGLTQPTVWPIIVGLLIPSIIFHEFGHASALRYGGGRARSIGVGLYIIYPVLYTDVTDNYRLGRWARVRTDLGGIYFNLVFALPVFVIALLTRQTDLLPLFVAVTDVLILEQLVPFVRLDGYWVLTDLTGVPDFFSLMGPFVLSLLPDRKRRSRLVAAYRPWVKVVFGLYTLVTLPLLAIMFVAMIRSVPYVLLTTWLAIQGQMTALPTGHTLRAIGQLLAALGRIVLLSFPVFAVLFFVFNLGRMALQLLWRWGRPTRARRAAACLLIGCALALVGMAWVPPLAQGFAAAARPPAAHPVRGAAPAARDAATGPDAFPSVLLRQRSSSAVRPGPCAPRATFGPTTATPRVLVAGTSLEMDAHITITCFPTARAARVDFEMYNSEGDWVWTYWLDEPMTGQQQTIAVVWPVPRTLPAGTYTLVLKVASSDGAATYGIDRPAAQVVVTQ